MAHPKHRFSKTRTKNRRTHVKAEAPAVSTCSNCGASIRPHRVCAECGYYKGKPAIEKEASA